MDDAHYRSFFLQPTDSRQRQYEALRAFFVERQPMSAIAQQFGYRHDTVRRLISDFRHDYDSERLPPFSSGPNEVGPQATRPPPTRRRRSIRLSPTCASWR
jgi:hypothetical protein